MIEINLLPGAGKKPRSRGGAGINFSGMASGIASKVNDPLLLSAVASVLVAALVIGGMFWHQRAQTTHGERGAPESGAGLDQLLRCHPRAAQGAIAA